MSERQNPTEEITMATRAARIRDTQKKKGHPWRKVGPRAPFQPGKEAEREEES